MVEVFIGSENVTVMGVVIGAFTAPFGGTTAMIVGGDMSPLEADLLTLFASVFPASSRARTTK